MPFRALRPVPQYAEKVAALPYDVMDSDEARAMVQGNPYSFLHVDKAEIDLPTETGIYSDAVYAKARENLDRLVADGVLRQDRQPCFYLYRLTMDGRSQTGVVGCASVAEYEQGIVKKHEQTRADKEADRVRHVGTLNAQTGPIFLAHRPAPALEQVVEGWAAGHAPLADFTAEDGVGHTVWMVDDEMAIAEIQRAYAMIPALYIADGHHRCASAAKVAQLRRQEDAGHTGNEEYEFTLSVLFPANQLYIMDYNRVVQDLNGLDRQAFLERLSAVFTVEPVSGPAKLQARRQFGMYLGGQWYRLCARDGVAPVGDPVQSLDVAVLQNNVLEPVLGIQDPRTDKRIDFVGGIRGLEELQQRVDAGAAVAFALYPTSMEELMAVSDAGRMMPPKSTWFEPKLRSGLFIHLI